jgi:hypothetical protein
LKKRREKTMAKKNPIYTSPKGVAVFPHITKPDTQFDPEGVYNTKLQIPEEKAGEFCKLLDEAHAQAVAQAKKDRKGKKGKAAKFEEADLPYEKEEDDEGDYTGNILVTRIKQKAVITKKDGEKVRMKVNVFDAKGKAFKPDYIGGGSTIKVAFQIIPFDTKTAGVGVTLRLKAVQVLDLQTGGNASSYGFGEEEGFDADEYEGDAVSGEESEEDKEKTGDENPDF